MFYLSNLSMVEWYKIADAWPFWLQKWQFHTHTHTLAYAQREVFSVYPASCNSKGFFKRHILHLLPSLSLINSVLSNATASPPLTCCPPGAVCGSSSSPTQLFIGGSGGAEGEQLDKLPEPVSLCAVVCCHPAFAHSHFLMITLTSLEMSGAAVVESN